MHLPTAARPSTPRRMFAVCATVTAVVLALLALSPGRGLAEPDRHVHAAGRTADVDRAADRADVDRAVSDDQNEDQNRNEDRNGDEDRNADKARGDDRNRNEDQNRDEARADDRNAADDRADGNGGNGNGSRSSDTVGAGGKDGNDNGLDVLGRDCSESKLDTHNGFQESPACVTTQMGEVAAEDKLPSLVIKDAPRTVAKGESFELQVSTRNLVRDRFLGAAAGGYYLEASFLNDDGLQRGHFHTACRILPENGDAPDSSGEPAFFLATEDGKGGTEPDTVTIEVPGIEQAGELQCTSWAGDGSHRTPMMTKANQTPAFDSVRITVTE